MAQKKINNFVIFMDQQLGKGAFGTVYKGQQDQTNTQCAIKVLDKKVITKDQYLKKAIFSEISILQSIKSENVVGVLDVMESTNNYYIVQELCDGDFQDLLHKRPELPEQDAIRYLKQMCNGFVALAREGIVHRDLKPANLMLKQDIIKIGDFGLAKKNITKRIKNQSSVGTPLYSPLQLLIGDAYTSKCDVWAVGCIFYEMMHRRTPWTANSEFQLVQNIRNQPLKMKPGLKPETKSFLEGCLGLEEEKRFGWDQVFNHPIFDGFFKQYALQNEIFEDKLKSTMNELRFQINSRNLNLNKLLESLGFKGKKDLSFKQFAEFIGHVQPHITKDEVTFFFEKMDVDADGSVSLSELESKMKEYDIQFDKDIELDLTGILRLGAGGIKKAESLEEMLDPNPLSKELEEKARKTFTKLYRILTVKKLTLYKVFTAYDSNRSGELSCDEFTKMVKRLDDGFEQEEVKALFDFIDNDFSGNVDFEEFNSYYCKINGVPESLQVPPEYYELQKKKFNQ